MTYFVHEPESDLADKIDALLALIATARCSADIDEVIDTLDKLEEKPAEVKTEAEELLSELESYRN